MAIQPKRRTFGQVVWLPNGQCILGFSYPPKEGWLLANYEIPFAPKCHAIVGTEHPFVWRNRETAQHVADCVGGRVELWEIDDFSGPIDLQPATLSGDPCDEDDDL